MSAPFAGESSAFGTATVRNSASPEMPDETANQPSSEDLVVLTPTRVRVDSRVVLVHCTSTWLSNCFFALLILFKLNDISQNSWWLVFLPTWVHHSISIPLQIFVLYFRQHFVEKHIGPQPPDTSPPTLVLQYDMVQKIRIRSHIVDATNSLIDNVALLLVKLLICYQLNYRMEMVAGQPEIDWWSFRLIFVPFWFAWVATTAVSFCKDKRERVFGSARDLMYAFFLFAAYKLDGRSNYSWRIVFLIPWVVFAAIFLLTLMVGILLLLARVWARMSDLVLPVGFMALLMACIPQFISCVLLVRMLDQIEASGATTVTLDWVILPNAASWFGMWCASLVLVVGLRQKEYMREMLLAAGHVWTAHERLANEVAETAQRRIDLMSDEEVASLVEDLMRGKTKPSMLVRVGESLYHTLSNEGTSVDRVGDLETGDELPASGGKTKGSGFDGPACDGVEMTPASPIAASQGGISLPGQTGTTPEGAREAREASAGAESIQPIPPPLPPGGSNDEETGLLGMAPAHIASNFSDDNSSSSAATPLPRASSSRAATAGCAAAAPTSCLCGRQTSARLAASGSTRSSSWSLPATTWARCCV
eukprot:CAMPEP_0117684608 /NCGR_PEP_ID=MMETSP0804-20121206/21206_1 /TAXON_ID=1074897 /ORGANISM="Tetraselmis astigmatica, Strain CCMP880" /LENGTH=591 /DNA_ID=CAMNT_0005495643 /DNA_START=347 /DNA_END=2123 /DNA_ORIENTATION=-